MKTLGIICLIIFYNSASYSTGCPKANATG